MKKYLACLLFWTLSVAAAEERVPVVILGSGMGGLTASIYLARAGYQPVVIEGTLPGGLLTQSHAVQNWPGELEIGGGALTQKVREQALQNGALFKNEELLSVDFSTRPLQLVTRSLDGTGATHRLLADVCLIAMGTQPNFLNIPGEKEYWGRGVSNCAICDGTLYRGKRVGVVGGGDAAVLEGLYLSQIAKQVDLFVRGKEFRATEKKRLEALLAKPNVKVHFGTKVEEVVGNQEGVTGVKVKKKIYPLDGLFLAIGSTPNSAPFKGQLKLDSKGYILLEEGQETSVPGVYAFGDIADPQYKQAVTAAGDGAKAALQAEKRLSELPPIAERREELLPPVSQGEVIEVSSYEQFQQELSQSDVPVIVDFYATWCAPCKRLSPLFEASAHQLGAKAKFLKVNVDALSRLSSTYRVRAMPTVVVLDPSGKEKDRRVGTEEIASLLKELEGERGFQMPLEIRGESTP